VTLVKQSISCCTFPPDAHPRASIQLGEQPSDASEPDSFHPAVLEPLYVANRYRGRLRELLLRDISFASEQPEEIAGHLPHAYRAIIADVSTNGLGGYGGRNLARLLGPLNVWSFALQRLTAENAGAAARAYEDMGYRGIWLPESLGSKEAMAQSAVLLAGTHRAVVAPGIANVHARDPMAMANGARTLGEAFPGRFVLGIGVSHAPSVETRGGDYGNPLSVMRRYLDAMDAAAYAAPAPDPPVPLVLAALGPKMLELAAQRADGAHPYFVPVEHTPVARRHLGPEPALITEVTAVLTTDRSAGLAIARAFAKHYLALPNYANNLRRLGWGEADITTDGSEAIIDAVVAIGDVDTIVRRVRDHLDAGADTVCLQIRAERSSDPSFEAYREIFAAFAA